LWTVSTNSDFLVRDHWSRLYIQVVAVSAVATNSTVLGHAGQLEVLPWSNTYVRDDRFDQDGMLALIEKLFQSGAAAGYALTRLVGHMQWALLDKPGVNNVLEYEARLNYLLPKYNDPVICTYDLSKFGASVVMYIMRTHPVVIIGGILQENPFYVPPDQFLRELRERQADRKRAATAN
jgi:hypothetical protein